MHRLILLVIASLTVHSIALITENQNFIEAVSELRRSNGTMNGDMPFAIPFHVSIQVQLMSGYKHLCGGSIIHSKAILTAAHCFHGNHPTIRLSVVAGMRKLSLAPTPRHRVSAVIQHEAYQPLYGNDIALVLLKQPLPIDGVHFDTVDYRLTENVELNREAYLIGWGRKQNILEIIDFTTISSKYCRAMGFKRVTSSDLCAYSKMGRGACDGDSGGALLSGNLTKQFGLLSYGKSICKRNNIYVYTGLNRMVGWIDSQLNKLVG